MGWCHTVCRILTGVGCGQGRLPMNTLRMSDSEQLKKLED